MSGAISGTAAQLQTQNSVARTIKAERLFHVIAGSVMLITTAVGFRMFIAHGKPLGGEITRQIVPLVVIHGLAMFSWVVLFLLQSIFIVNGNRRLHMRIGVAGAVLAGLIVVLGSATAILSTHYSPDSYQMFGGARFFLASMLGEMLAFGTFVAIAVLYRRRAEIHRPMMLLGSVMINSGALARCPYIGAFGFKPPLYVLGPAVVLGALFFILQWAMTRMPSRWYAIGYAGFVIASVVFVAVGHSAVWNQIAAAVVP